MDSNAGERQEYVFPVGEGDSGPGGRYCTLPGRHARQTEHPCIAQVIVSLWHDNGSILGLLAALIKLPLCLAAPLAHVQVSTGWDTSCIESTRV